MKIIGQMSGTSLDGVDSVLVDIDDHQCEVVARHHIPFNDKLKQLLLSLCESGDDEIHRAATASNQLSRIYAESAKALIEASPYSSKDIDAIGCHGQTVRHIPPHYSIQLINGALLAELTGIDVVCDFRSRDIAAGGQGAPLVPAFHHALFSKANENVAVVNIGGMANISLLHDDHKILGYDTGPGNVLMDAWCKLHKQQAYDEHGQWAASGEVIPDLLNILLDDPYFSLPAPKSTGREHFNLAWLKPLLKEQYAKQDVQATLSALTARTIANEIRRHWQQAEVIVCGGGAKNLWLMRQLEKYLEGFQVKTSEQRGVNSQDIEAMAFAWLAKRCIDRKAGNVSDVTGAQGKRILGAIYPA